MPTLNTIIPIIKLFPNTIFSIDTYKPKVANYGLKNGFQIINDIFENFKDNKNFTYQERRFAESDNVKILEFLIGESRIEVSVPQDETSGTAKFLATRGSGIHHVCFYSEDIESDVALSLIHI